MSLKITDLPLVPSGTITQDISIPVAQTETNPKTYKMSLSQMASWLSTNGGGQGYSGFSGFSGAGGGGGGPVTGIGMAITPANVFFYNNDGTPKTVQTATITATLQNLTPSSGNKVVFKFALYNTAGVQVDNTGTPTSTITSVNGTGTNFDTTTFSTTNLGTAATAAISAVFVNSGTTYVSRGQITRVTDGADGKPAIYGSLTNPTVALAADSSGNVSDYSTTYGSFVLHKGATLLTSNVVYSKTGTDTNCVGSIDSATGIYHASSFTPSANTASTSFQATYTDPVTLVDTVITATLTLTKSKQGNAGTAKNVALTVSKNIFVFSDANTPLTSGDTITVTVATTNIVPGGNTPTWAATLYNASGSVVANSGILNTVPGHTDQRSVPVTAFTSNPTAVTCTVTYQIQDSVDNFTYGDATTIVKLTNGTNGGNGTNGTSPYTTILSNPLGTINADMNGNVTLPLTYLTGDFVVYYGSADVTSSCTGFGVYDVVNAQKSDITFSAGKKGDGSASGVSNHYAVNTIRSGLTINFILSAVYTDSNSVAHTVYATFTVSKILAGPTGDSGTGPVYRGTYNTGTSYFYIAKTRADIVKYSGSYWITNNASKSGKKPSDNGGWNTPGTDTDWAAFGAQFSSIATDLLLAQDVAITRYLNMGQTGDGGSLENTAIRSVGTSPSVSFAKTSTGSMTTPLGGVYFDGGSGFYLGFPQGATNVGNDAMFYVGNGTTGSNSNYLLWDGNNLNIAGSINLSVQSTNAIFSGKTSYGDTTGGFWLGVDVDGGNRYPKLNLGNADTYLKWDTNSGSLNVKGMETVSEIVVNSNLGIRYADDVNILTLTGGVANGVQSGAQIDMAGSQQGNSSSTVQGIMSINAGIPSTSTSPDAGRIRFGTGDAGGNPVHTNYERMSINKDGLVHIKNNGTGSDNAGNLTVDGTVTASNFNTTSSRKWKENITPITNALNTITKLQGVTFDWNNKDIKNDFGLIAEDVNEILPTIVNKDKENNITGVDYGRITALLIETIKELNVKIVKLENQLANR
jgi:Chaperone of endosialidase